MRMRVISALVCASLSAGTLPAQSATLEVRDTNGFPIPYAVVTVNGAGERPTDARGRLALTDPMGQPLRVSVRRIGYTPFSGTASCAGEPPACSVTLARIAAAVDSLVVVASPDTPLARSGFYDRMERVRTGAMRGLFILPEELESRNASRVTDLLAGRRFVRVSNGVLYGLNGCRMHIVVDRVHVSARDRMEARGSRIDDLVIATEVAAIEVYASTTSTPAELQVLASEDSCGMVVIWTGGRR